MCKLAVRCLETFSNDMLSYTSKITYKPSKLEQTDLVLVCDQSLSAGLCKGDYKSLYAVVMT